MKIKEYCIFILLSMLSGIPLIFYFYMNMYSAFIFMFISIPIALILNQWFINIILTLYFKIRGYKILCINIYPIIIVIETKVSIYHSFLSFLEIYSCIDFDYLEDTKAAIMKYYNDYVKGIVIVRCTMWLVVILIIAFGSIVNLYLSLYFAMIEIIFLYYYSHEFLSTNAMGILSAHEKVSVEKYVWPFLSIILSHTYKRSIMDLLIKVDIRYLTYPTNLFLEYCIYHSIYAQEEYLDMHLMKRIDQIILDKNKFSLMLENERLLVSYFIYVYYFRNSSYDELLLEYYNNFVSAMSESNNIFVKNYYCLKNRNFDAIKLCQMMYAYNKIPRFKNKLEVVKQRLQD